MARTRGQHKRVEERVWVVSGPGSDEDWRRRVANELQTRGALARNPQESLSLVVVVGHEFISRSGRLRVSKELSALYGVINQALKTNTLIIPLLVDGAGSPSPNDLPDAIRKFHFQNALRLDSPDALAGAVAKIIAASRLRNSKTGTEVRTAAQSARSIFISYRRDDTGHWAQMLARTLALLLGSEGVYLDVGSGRPGGDFRLQIETRLEASSDVVVLIGPGFLAADRSGRRRIEKADDYVRWEISQALKLGKQLHVVLVSSGQMPNNNQLPQEIRALTGIKSVYNLPSNEQVEHVANQIVGSSRITGAFRGLGTISKSRVAGMRAGQGYESRADSIASALAEHGWYLFEQGGRNKDSILSHKQFPEFRFSNASGFG